MSVVCTLEFAHSVSTYQPKVLTNNCPFVWAEAFFWLFFESNCSSSLFIWFGLIWFGLVWLGLAWFGLVWVHLVRFGLVRFGLVRFGLVWFGGFPV